MELSQELLFTVAISLMVSFILAKLLSMASASDASEENSVSASKKVIYEHKDDKELVVFDFEIERRVRVIEEAVEVNDHEEETFRVGKIEVRESPLISDDNEQIHREVEICEEQEKVSVGGDELAGNMVDESPGKSEEFREIEKELVCDLEGKSNRGNESDGVNNEDGDGEREEEGGLSDDWEGIERTEMEKVFGAAVAFVGSKGNADCVSLFDNDVKRQLYGLHKIAVEGPCHESQPMALKVSARAKWNTWKQLGNMNPDVAMEQYIILLSRSVPHWMGDGNSEDGKHAFLDVGTSGKLPSNLQKQPDAENERKLEQLKARLEEYHVIGVKGPSFINTDK